jgi:transcription initiation factor TFIIIB Brf1 subunit/transcription initiation factor TFIIB
MGINQVLKLSWQIANNANSNGQEDSNGSKTITTITEKDKIRLQAAALANDCYKYIMDLTTNGVVITDAIKFVQTNKEKLTMSGKEEKDKESEEPDYDEEQEKETGELDNETTNHIF